MGKNIRSQPMKMLDECLRRVKAAKPAGSDIVDADLHRCAQITGQARSCRKLRDGIHLRCVVINVVSALHHRHRSTF